jgi:predicted  nucleic acid-binding Zn-ribbon protein
MKISSLLREAENPNQGTVNQLPVDRDLIYRAKNKYPGYSSEQAMILLISDEMKNQEKTDSVQNRLIDTQKRENERLRGAVDSLGQELQDFEQQSQETDREVERLKQLSSTLTTGGTDTKRKAKLSADDLEKLHADLETLKTKPGMDPKKFQQLEQQIKLMASNPSVGNADIAKINSLLDTLNKQKTIGDELYKKVEDQLVATQTELDKKENRFKGYIDKKKGEVSDMQASHAGEIQKYADIVNNYQKEIKNFDNELQKMKKEKDIMYDLRAGVMKDAEDISKMKNDVSKKLDFINKHIQKITNTDSSPKDVADVPWLMGGARKTQNTQQTQNMPTNVQESIIYTEGYTPAPSRQYRNAKYNEWITKHFLGLFNLFKGRYAKDLEEKGYSDKQVADTLEEYIPLLYNLGNDKTPLTPTEVIPWAENVKDKLWELPAQYELFNESLDKTYARMLDNIIGLDYIKKG